MNTLTEESPAADSATAKSLAQNMAATTGRPFSECWNAVRSARPELFGLANRESIANREASEASERQERLVMQNRSAGLSAASIGRPDTRTCTERFHGAQLPPEPEGPRIVNRLSVENSADVVEAVQEYQRKNGIATFSQAWDRAKVAHPDWFFATV